MAAYNGGKYLREQLDSILAQTYRDFLLYIRDDGSTDDTPQILAQYAAQDSRIRMVADMVKHRGCSGSFRYLTETVDADCYLFPTRTTYGCLKRWNARSTGCVHLATACRLWCIQTCKWWMRASSRCTRRSSA